MINIDIIEKKYTNAQKSLVSQSSDLSLQSISTMVDSGAIDISPKYQRRDRWKVDKQSSLIESFLLNIPVPPIYLAENVDGTYSVIDGKQRITAIHKYLKNILELKKLEKFKELEGTKFSDLPSSLEYAFSIRPYLRVVTMLRQSDPELKHEVFLRLNKAGVALNSQEIRNVAYRGKLNDLLFELADNDFFKSQFNITPKSKMYAEMTDVQYVLRFFTVLEYWDKFPGNMDVAMDAFMSKNYNAPSSEIKRFKEKFNTSIKICQEIWEEDAFMKPKGNRRALQGFYDMQMVGVALLSKSKQDNLRKKKKAVKQKLIDKINSDVEFEGALTQFTSNPARMELRIRKARELFRAI